MEIEENKENNRSNKTNNNKRKANSREVPRSLITDSEGNGPPPYRSRKMYL